MSKLSYYEYFGLTNFEPDQDKIKRAYRSMALQKHPDRGGNAEDMKTVNEVYRVLSKHKDEYDHHLRTKLGMTGGLRMKDNLQGATLMSDAASIILNWRMPY